MNGPDEIDVILAGWFLESAPATVPAEIHAGVIARARSSRQHVRLSATLRDALSRPAARPAVQAGSLVVVVVAILATTFVIGGPPAAVPPIPGPSAESSSSAESSPSAASSPSQIASPSARSSASDPPSDGPQATGMVDKFVPSFTYTIPDGSGLVGIGGVPGAVAWVVGPNDEPTASSVSHGFGGQDPENHNLHGIMVANVSNAWGHGPDGRVRLRGDPAGFLVDMDALLTRFDLEPVTDTTLDGRPALTARTVPGSGPGYDLHVDGPMNGLVGPGILLAAPYRITVADIDGVTVVVEVWAHSEDDLATWLPVAQRFVDSMRFVGP